GFGGDIGLMVGVDVSNDKIIGVGVTTHQETPGLGSRAQTDPKFAAQFGGLPIIETFKVKTDGGQVDALSGATISSQGVCLAATDAGVLYKRLKDKITEELKNIQTQEFIGRAIRWPNQSFRNSPRAYGKKYRHFDWCWGFARCWR
ncbi:MAG: FMN-binding protein, partial [Planctomycetes bacterium]|nr:FMN-binding protein [Planctomycetota bacterium]